MAQILTGASATIELNGQPVGLAENIEASFTYTRNEVKQIGSIKTVEAPVTSFTGQLSIGNSFIDLEEYSFARGLYMQGGSQQESEDSLVLDSNVGISLTVFKKVEDAAASLASDGLKVAGAPEKIFVLTRVMLDSVSFSISNGTYATASATGIILDLPVFPK